ncbi:MAG: hypothetical protein LBS75_02845, partial [Synergistaceae bacterium]|nr:hypothetical protein [Synergistaceae bacterium]
MFSRMKLAKTVPLLFLFMISALSAASADTRPDVSWYTANPEADEFYIDDEAGLFGLWVLMSDAVGDYIA